MRVLIDATQMRARATGVARYERELVARVTSAVDAVTVVRRAAVRDGSADAVTGKVVAVPDSWPTIVVEQVFVPLLSWIHRVDVVHSMAGGQAVLGLRGRRVVTFHEDRRAYHARHHIGSRYERLAAKWHVWAAERSLASADRVLTVSETSARQLDDLQLTRGRPLPAQHGVSDVFRKPPGSARASFMLMLLSDDPRDDVALVLEAMHLAQTGSELVVAGRVSDTTRARLDAQALEWELTVRAAGEVSDEELAALYSTCLCFIHASDYEGFGLAVLEAMACGAAVVALPSAALDEVAGGVALTARDAREMSFHLQRVTADAELRDELGRLGARRSRQFTWDRAAAITLSAYRR